MNAKELTARLKNLVPTGAQWPVKVRMEDLYGMAQATGAPIKIAGLEELSSRLMQLSPNDRDYVISQLARGEPAEVVRPLRPGEQDNGDRRQVYSLVAMPPPTPSALVQAAQDLAAAMKPTQQANEAPAAPGGSGEATPWEAELARAKRRSNYQPMPFMPGQHGALAFKAAAAQRMQRAATGVPTPQTQQQAVGNAIADPGQYADGSGSGTAVTLRHMARDQSAGAAFFNRSNGRF